MVPWEFRTCETTAGIAVQGSRELRPLLPPSSPIVFRIFGLKADALIFLVVLLAVPWQGRLAPPSRSSATQPGKWERASTISLDLGSGGLVVALYNEAVLLLNMTTDL